IEQKQGSRTQRDSRFRSLRRAEHLRDLAYYDLRRKQSRENTLLEEASGAYNDRLLGREVLKRGPNGLGRHRSSLETALVGTCNAIELSIRRPGDQALNQYTSVAPFPIQRLAKA